MNKELVYPNNARREVFVALFTFLIAALFFIATSAWGTTISTSITTAHLKASSTVQGTGDIIGYANLLLGGTTSIAASVDVAFGGAAGTHADVYVSGGLGVGNATTSDGDFVVGDSLKVYNSALSGSGRVLIGATTTSQGFTVEKASSIFSSGADATTTVGIVTESTTKGGCIEMTAATDGALYKVFINAAGNGLTVEAGAC